MTCLHPFGSHLNFLDQQTTADGKPFAPIRYKQIVKECYLLSKNINTPYTEILKITPTERLMMLNFLAEEAKQNQEYIEKKKAEREAKRKGKSRN